MYSLYNTPVLKLSSTSTLLGIITSYVTESWNIYLDKYIRILLLDAEDEQYWPYLNKIITEIIKEITTALNIMLYFSMFSKDIFTIFVYVSKYRPIAKIFFSSSNKFSRTISVFVSWKRILFFPVITNWNLKPVPNS